MPSLPVVSLERWAYLAIHPTNLFIYRTLGSPVRAEDFHAFAPTCFQGAVAAGLDDARVAFAWALSEQTFAAANAAVRRIQRVIAALEPDYQRAVETAPSRVDDVFAIAAHVLGMARDMAENPATSAVSALLSTMENAEKARKRLAETRNAAALYAGALMLAAAEWREIIVSDIFPSLSVDFQRAGLA